MILHPLAVIPLAAVLMVTASFPVIAATNAEEKAATDAEKIKIAAWDHNTTTAKETEPSQRSGSNSKVSVKVLPEKLIDLQNTLGTAHDEGELFLDNTSHFAALSPPLSVQELDISNSTLAAADNDDLNRVGHSVTGNPLPEEVIDSETSSLATKATDEKQNLDHTNSSVEKTPQQSQELDFKKEVLLAEEDGSGHWPPGAARSFAGILPPIKGLYFKNLLLYYNFKASVSRGLPDGTQAQFGSTGNLLLNYSYFTYVTGAKVLGGDLAAGLVIPFLYTDVSAELITPNRTLGAEDRAFGLSDIVINPLILGWHHGNYHWLTGIGVFAPTGDYTTGSLAQLGKNYWSIGPYAGFTYFNLKSGLEASILGGITFNTENSATDYDSGDQLHIDWLVAKHFPNRLALGVTGFIYQQITGDSGEGAVLGDFRGRTFSVGPSVRYSTAGGVGLEFKWLPEFGVQNRPSGNLFYFNVSLEL